MATLVRFDPFRELVGFQNDMSRLVSGLLEGNGNGRSGQAWVPALDAWETKDEIVYAFDLPGVPEDKISVELEDDVLTVTAVRERAQQTESEGLARWERRYGTFTRTIGLPAGVGDADLQASYKDGVLELRVRKPEERKPRRIPVGSAQPTIEGATTES